MTASGHGTSMPDKHFPGFKDRVLIIFTRYPEPGKVKTRLIPALGAAGAARLQREMTLRAVKIARMLHPDIAVELHCEGGSEAEAQTLFGADVRVECQSEGDLGQRMLESFCRAFGQGFRRVVLIGTDCPLITRKTIEQAFDSLDSYDCVFGPAVDGGYYLIGLKQPCREFFDGIPWGNACVLDETLARAHSAGFTTALLEHLPDIDHPEDIPIWAEAYYQECPMISVVIPALDEEAVIARTIRHLENGSNIEVILADGGSHDRTAALAASCGARVVLSQPGRAVQMNTGARHAQGEILLFLHADTRLPENFDRHIRQALTDPGTIAGAFSLGFDHDRIALKIMAWGANTRSCFLQIPYGDQGIFLRSVDFHMKGGFPDLPIMEDAVFINALKKEGRIITLPAKAVTSARRYAAMGALHTWIINRCVKAGFLMGADPAGLARLYRSHAGIGKWVPFLWDISRTRHRKSG